MPLRQLPYLLLVFATSLATATPAPPPTAPWAEQRADLEAVRDDYVLASRAFAPAARSQALARIDALLKREQALAPAAWMAELMRISALAGNGHDYFNTGRGWFPERRLPLRLLWLADGLVVSRAAPAQAELLGGKVLGIDGHDPDAIMASLQRHDGSLPGYQRGNKPWLLESTDLLQAIGIAAQSDRIRIEVETPEGHRIAREVAAVASSEVPMDLGRIGAYSTHRSAYEQKRDWRDAVEAAEDPLYLQQPDRQFRIVDLAELDALYLQFRANFDGADERVVDFAERARQAIEATPRSHLILDQRFNYGGNSDLTLELMRQIGAHARGRVYVLTSGATFSAGMVSTALVKQVAAGRARLVGEPVGDRLRWWSEGHETCLPHSGYCLHVSDGLWDLQHGCAGEEGCYGDRFGIRIDHLDPDLPATLTIADWRAGRDPLLDAVAKDLAGAR